MNTRTLRLAASLGVDAACADRSHAARTAALAQTAAQLNDTLGAGQIAFITGPSGAGKSTLLSLLPRTTHTVIVAPLTSRQSRTRVASLCARTPLTQWASLLARFGLAEASVLTSRAANLSAGEHARLQLALAAARCERLHTRATGHGALTVTGAGDHRPRQEDSPTLIIDEWCSVLDRATAASIASSASRWARERTVRLIGATAHQDLAPAINPDITITLNVQGGEGDTQWTPCTFNKAG